jgi:hypothetical protein
VKTKEVGTGEEGNDELMDLSVVNASEEGCNLAVEFFGGGLGKGDENVHAVHEEAVCFTSWRLSDGSDNVSSEGGEGRCGRCWVSGGAVGWRYFGV